MLPCYSTCTFSLRYQCNTFLDFRPAAWLQDPHSALLERCVPYIFLRCLLVSPVCGILGGMLPDLSFLSLFATGNRVSKALSPTYCCTLLRALATVTLLSLTVSLFLFSGDCYVLVMQCPLKRLRKYSVAVTTKPTTSAGLCSTSGWTMLIWLLQCGGHYSHYINWM